MPGARPASQQPVNTQPGFSKANRQHPVHRYGTGYPGCPKPVKDTVWVRVYPRVNADAGPGYQRGERTTPVPERHRWIHLSLVAGYLAQQPTLFITRFHYRRTIFSIS